MCCRRPRGRTTIRTSHRSHNRAVLPLIVQVADRQFPQRSNSTADRLRLVVADRAVRDRRGTAGVNATAKRRVSKVADRIAGYGGTGQDRRPDAVGAAADPRRATLYRDVVEVDLPARENTAAIIVVVAVGPVIAITVFDRHVAELERAGSSVIEHAAGVTGVDRDRVGRRTLDREVADRSGCSPRSA